MYVTLAARNIFRNRSRSLITLASISAGCASLILAGGFIHHTLTNLKEGYIHDFLGHVRIYAPGFSEHGTLHPFDYMITEPEKLLQEIRSVPHVLYAAPRLSFAGLLSTGDSSVAFLGEGLDPSVETPSRTTALLKAGDYLTNKDIYSIWLGNGLAKTLGSKPGNSLVLMTNTKQGALNAADVHIQGLFATASKPYDDHTARIPLGLAQKLLRTDEIQNVIIFLDDTQQTPVVKEALQRRLREAGLNYEVKAWYEMEDADFVLKAETFYQRMFLVLKIIIIFVVTLSIINTLNMAVLERIGEIGTMMAVGTTRRGVVYLFILEALFLGVLGGAFGCIIGYIMAIVITHIGIHMPSPPGTTMTWIARVSIVPSVFAEAWLLAIVTALFSSILPAAKASRLEIADALRHNL